MKLVKGVVFVVGVVVVALGMFNGLVVVVSAYFGPFYQGDADQSRNFGLWLVGNGLLVLGAALSGAVWYGRRLSRRRK